MKIDSSDEKGKISRNAVTISFAVILMVALGLGAVFVYDPPEWLSKEDVWGVRDEENFASDDQKQTSGVSEDSAEEEEQEAEEKIEEVYGKIRESCQNKDWESLAVYMDSDSFDVVNEQLEIIDPIDLSEDRLLNVTQKDGCRVIIYGSLDGGNNGTAAGIISAEQVYAVYEGEWTRGVPDGFGKVIIWNKDETYSDAIIMNGEMDRGVLSGTSEITGDGFRKVEFEVEKGVFGDVGKDKDGASYEIKTGDDVNDQSYAAGVPGYWASDIKPELIPVN